MNRRGRSLGRREQWSTTCKKEALIEDNCLNKEEGNIWIGRDGGFSIIATLLGDIHGESETSEIVIIMYSMKA